MKNYHIRLLVLVLLIVFVVFNNACQKQVDYSADIKQLKADMLALQKRTDSLTAALASLNTNFGSLSGRVDSIRGQITLILTQINSLTTQLAQANANIANINTQIADLNKQMAYLLAQLNAIIAQLSASNTINNGLVGYWPFNGNANDESGNGNNGRILGNVVLTTDRKGGVNKAYLFPGSSSSYIDCGNSATLRISQNLTISAWIYMDGGYFNPRVISYEGSSRTGYGMSVGGTSNTSRYLEALFVRGSGLGVGFCCGGTSGIVVPALSWQHVVFTADNGIGKLYLNGKLLKTVSGVIVNEANYTNTLNIGRLSQPAFDAWGGKLDEIRIYNRALSQEEITYLSNN